jgi:hypothetical protein
MSYRTLKSAIFLDVLEGIAPERSVPLRLARRNGVSGRALHCLLVSVMPSNSLDIVNIEGIKALNYNRGSLLS